MDTAEHSTRAPQLPAKLRWRPYGNGSTLKQKKSKREDSMQEQYPAEQDTTHGLNPKALAHKVRSTPPHPVTFHHPPSTVQLQLQWEEAETIESMSHGGHPHNQHHPHIHHVNQQRRHTRSDTDTDSTTTSSHRASSSLPSPPPSSKSPTSRLAVFGGDSDLGQYKGSVPGLTGDDFLEHGLPLRTIEANTAYQVALNALLENHRKNQLLDAQAPALALTSVPMPMSVTSPPATLSDKTLNRSVFPMGSDGGSRRKLSTSELLGIVNIDDLLTSCGYTDTDNSTESAASTFASPTTTDRSLHASPVNGLLDLHTSPMDITTASFDMLLAQTPVLLTEGDIKQVLLRQQQHQQQQQQQQLNTSPTLSMASTISNSFAEIIHDLASPFIRMTAHGDPLINGNTPSTWPSLFPRVSDDVSSTRDATESVDIVTQTDQPNETPFPLSPTSSTSPRNSLTAHLGFSKEEETDPEWLSFLDEASPLFSAENGQASGSLMEHIPSTMSSPLSNEIPTTAGVDDGQPKISTLQDNGFLGWAEDFLKAGAMAPTGHRSFPTAGSMGPFAGGAGGMIRSLQGNYQQRSSYHTKAGSRRTGSSSVLPALPRKNASGTQVSVNNIPETPAKPDANEQSRPQVQAQPQKIAQVADSNTKPRGGQEMEGVGGLLAMFRGLWKGEK
ncbi:hypothetical protein EDD21DRAFT_384536 [Dissophora ornata]|nr:hypothetical protein EDD21DRAFT_384536 [Dissophora ornata]